MRERLVSESKLEPWRLTCSYGGVTTTERRYELEQQAQAEADKRNADDGWYPFVFRVERTAA